MLREPEDIQDEGHLAVPHDGRAREAGDSLELLAKRLDDDFLGVVDLVHDEPELSSVRLQHHDVDRIPGGGGRGLKLELLVEVGKGEKLAAEAVDRGPVKHLDPGTGLLGLEPDQLQEADLGDREALAPARDDEGRDDGEGEGDLDLDGGPGVALAEDVHRAADLLDVGLHHVHPNAPA